MSFSYVNQSIELSPYSPVSPLSPYSPSISSFQQPIFVQQQQPVVQIMQPQFPQFPQFQQQQQFVVPNRMTVVNPNTIGQLITPRYKNTFPNGINPEIHFYDPITGRPEIIVDSKPTVSTIEFRREESESSDDCDTEEEYYELTENNLRMLTKKINDCGVRKRKSGMKNAISDQHAYPDKSWQLMGDLLVHPSISTVYSGSGVMLFEKNFNLNNKLIHTVLLGKRKNGQYDDFGGRITTFQTQHRNAIENSLALNAKDKVKEKSCALFVMNTNIYNNAKIEVSYKQNNSIYRCYLVGISGSEKISEQDLTNSLLTNKQIQRNRNKNYHLQTDMQQFTQISRFSLKELFKLVDPVYNEDSDEIIAENLSGQKCVLSDRVVKIIQEMRSNKKYDGAVFTDMYSVEHRKGNMNATNLVI